MEYRFGGKEKGLSFGVYPEVSLKTARQRRDDARSQLANGIDPGEARRAVRIAKAGAESVRGDREYGTRSFQEGGYQTMPTAS